MFCTSCGREVQDGTKYCGQCGALRVGTPSEGLSPVERAGNVDVVLTESGTSKIETIRGWVVVVKGILITIGALFVLFLCVAVLRIDPGSDGAQMCLFFGFGAGAAHLGLHLYRWKRQKIQVNGIVFVAIVWVILLLFEFIELVGVLSHSVDVIFWACAAMVILTSAWVWADAKRLGLRRGTKRGPVAFACWPSIGMDPPAWFLGCLLMWIVFFPFYLVERNRFKAEEEKLQPSEASGPSSRFSS